jgi:hypothetical protein
VEDAIIAMEMKEIWKRNGYHYTVHPNTRKKVLDDDYDTIYL